MGDRVKVQNITIGDGWIQVDLIQHGPDDAMCCPSQRATRYFELTHDKLIER